MIDNASVDAAKRGTRILSLLGLLSPLTSMPPHSPASSAKTPFPRSRPGFWPALLLGLIIVWPAAAQQVDYPIRRGTFTPGELAMLPPYCKSMQGMPGYTGPEGDRWRAILGPDLMHIHHYCRGLRDVYYLTYTVVTPVQRRFLWNRAINEYDYMIRASRIDMPLMPEFYFRRGEALVMLGQLAEAEFAFQEARRLKPSYAAAYAAWADQLMHLKLHDRAQALLLEGLQNAPGNAALLDRLQRLPDGKKLAAKLRSKWAAVAASAPAPASSSSSVAASQAQ